MRLLIQKVDVMANAVDLIGDRTTALEGAVADVSQSGIEVDSSTGRGLASAATMVAASADRRERVPDHDPSGDETLELRSHCHGRVRLWHCNTTPASCRRLKVPGA